MCGCGAPGGTGPPPRSCTLLGVSGIGGLCQSPPQPCVSPVLAASCLLASCTCVHGVELRPGHGPTAVSEIAGLPSLAAGTQRGEPAAKIRCSVWFLCREDGKSCPPPARQRPSEHPGGCWGSMTRVWGCPSRTQPPTPAGDGEDAPTPPMLRGADVLLRNKSK